MKIVHLINPYKSKKENASYLYYAQPITLKSMYLAKKHAKKKGIKVKLYAINFEEDNDVVPKYFKKLPNLKKSTLSLFPKISKNRKLPIIQEMFNSVLKNCSFDYIIFTNLDIGVQKNFYTSIYSLIKNMNLKSLIINRRDNIPKFKNNKRLTKKDIKLIYREKGEKHPGKDCFIIKREILKKINMDSMFTGYSPWGNTLYYLLKKKDINIKVFKNLFLTFHLGKDRAWKKSNNKLLDKNLELSKIIKKKV